MKNIRDRFFVRYKQRNKNVWVTKKLDSYLVGLSETRIPTALADDYNALMRTKNHTYQTPINQLEFIALLAKQNKARNILELGTFKGFTALYLATVLGKDTRITTCEIDEQNIKTAQALWKKHGVQKQIKLLAGNAVANIEKLPSTTYDIIYIDADKNQYPAYYAAAKRLRSTGGLILLDNMLWAGLVAEGSSGWSHATMLSELNKTIYAAGHADVSMIPAWDGLLIVRG